MCLCKLLSTVLANQLKDILDSLISKSQCGFIQGRYIGEVTRLIYDIINHMQKSEIEGLLMLIEPLILFPVSFLLCTRLFIVYRGIY